MPLSSSNGKAPRSCTRLKSSSMNAQKNAQTQITKAARAVLARSSPERDATRKAARNLVKWHGQATAPSEARLRAKRSEIAARNPRPPNGRTRGVQAQTCGETCSAKRCLLAGGRDRTHDDDALPHRGNPPAAERGKRCTTSNTRKWKKSWCGNIYPFAGWQTQRESATTRYTEN